MIRRSTRSCRIISGKNNMCLLESIVISKKIGVKNIRQKSYQNKSNKGAIKVVKTQRLSEVFFSKLFLDRYQPNNQLIVKELKYINSQNKRRLKKYCLKYFNNLPLFLIYQISLQLGLKQVYQRCANELINQNYEQLNYKKYDLIKCSFVTLKKIFSCYKQSKQQLQIQGLRYSDLKIIIDQYCKIHNIQQGQKQNFMAQYVSKDLLNISEYIQKQTKNRDFLKSNPQNLVLSAPLASQNMFKLNQGIPVLKMEHDFEFEQSEDEEYIMKRVEKKQKHYDINILTLYDSNIEGCISQSRVVSKSRVDTKNQGKLSEVSSYKTKQQRKIDIPQYDVDYQDLKLQLQQLNFRQRQLGLEIRKLMEEINENNQKQIVSQSLTYLSEKLKQLQENIATQNQEIQLVGAKLNQQLHFIQDFPHKDETYSIGFGSEVSSSSSLDYSSFGVASLYLTFSL